MTNARKTLSPSPSLAAADGLGGGGGGIAGVSGGNSGGNCGGGKSGDDGLPVVLQLLCPYQVFICETLLLKSNLTDFEPSE